MAPKGRAKARGQPKAAPKAAAKAAAAPLDAVQAPQPKRRQLNRRDTAEQARRALTSHAPTIPQEQLNSSVNNAGLSPQAQVEQDIRSARASGSRLGASYWRGFSQQFGFDQLNSAPLVVRDPNEAVGADLLAGISKAIHRAPAQRDSSELRQLLQFRPSLNQKEFVGVANSFFRMSQQQLLNRPALFDLWLTLLECIVRLEMTAHWENELELLKPWFNEALERSWSSSKAVNITARTWMSGRQGLLQVYVQQVDMQRILASPQDDDRRREQRQAQVRASNVLPVLGLVLQQCLDQYAGVLYSTRIRSLVGPMAAATTEAQFGEVKTQCMRLAAEELVQNPRGDVSLTRPWLGDEVQLSGLSVHAAWNIDYASQCKLLLLCHTTAFPRYPWEDELLPPVQVQQINVPFTDVSSWTSARSQGKDMLAALGSEASYADMLRIMSNDQRVLLAADGTYLFELEWMSKYGPAALDAKLRNAALDPLPDAARHPSIAEVVDRLATLIRSRAFKLGSAAAQSDVTTIKGMIQGLASHSTPKLGSNLNAFYTQVMARIIFFYRDGNAADGGPAYGADAWQACFARYAAAAVPPANTLPTLEQLQVLQTYRWARNVAQNNELGEWVKRVVATATTTTRTAASSSRAARAASAAGTDDDEGLMSLFG